MTVGTMQFGKIGVLVNLIVQELKFCKLISFWIEIFASVSLKVENLRGLREDLKHKIRTYVRFEQRFQTTNT